MVYKSQVAMPEDTGLGEAEVSAAMSESENEYDELEAHKDDDDDKMAEQNAASDATGEKKKYDPKDPTRPRRKKARRACFACQRAHLTCGKPDPCYPLITASFVRNTSNSGFSVPLVFFHSLDQLRVSFPVRLTGC